MKTTALATALIIAASASGAFAGDTASDKGNEHGPGKFFELVDTNKDGKIDIAEFTAAGIERAGKTFDKIDTEGKGVISRDQFLKSAEGDAKARFEKMDRNKDSALTKEDRPKHGGKHKSGPADEIPPPPEAK